MQPNSRTIVRNTEGVSNLDPRKRLMEGAKRYAQADRSNPFAFNVAMSHINNGITDLVRIEKPFYEAYYDAKPVQETRTYTDSGGKKHEYTVNEYRDITRP